MALLYLRKLWARLRRNSYWNIKKTLNLIEFLVSRNICVLKSYHRNLICFFFSGDIDDLEFWLSTDATPAKQTTPTEPAAATTTTEDTPTKTSSKKRSKKKGGAKAEPTPEVTPVVSVVMDEPEPGEGGEGGEAGEVREEEGKRRKKKGEKVSHAM